MDKFGNYLKWELFEKQIEEKGLLYFSLFDLERIFPNRKLALKKYLGRKVREKQIIRLKRNLYCLANKIPNDYLLANILYQPSYISLELALSYYSIIPETVYSVTSVTSKATREFSFEGKIFSYQAIKKKAFCDYQPQKIDSLTFLIATPEKALADYLYFVSLGKKRLNERMNWEKVDGEKVKNYLEKTFQISALKVSKLVP